MDVTALSCPRVSEGAHRVRCNHHLDHHRTTEMVSIYRSVSSTFQSLRRLIGRNPNTNTIGLKLAGSTPNAPLAVKDKTDIMYIMEELEQEVQQELMQEVESNFLPPPPYTEKEEIDDSKATDNHSLLSDEIAAHRSYAVGAQEVMTTIGNDECAPAVTDAQTQYVVCFFNLESLLMFLMVVRNNKRMTEAFEREDRDEVMGDAAMCTCSSVAIPPCHNSTERSNDRGTDLKRDTRNVVEKDEDATVNEGQSAEINTTEESGAKLVVGADDVALVPPVRNP